MNLKPFEILMLEDAVEDADLLEEALGQVGFCYNFNVIDNGVDALLYLKKMGKYEGARIPDVIILDLNLPRKNGFEVLIEIRENDEWKKIPVVILTSAQLGEEDLATIKVDPKMYIRKSNDFRPLVQLVMGLNKN